MRGCNISRFVAPDCPSTERQLTEKKCDPQLRQPLERGDLWHISPNARRKRNDCGCNQQCQKAVRHLQPDLESVHVRQAAGIAPGIDLCQRGRTCVWNPGAVCSRKIENRQIAMLMAHCRSKRKLHVNRERDCDRERLGRREVFPNSINIPKRIPETSRYQRDHYKQSEERLGYACMEDADFIFQHGDSKTAENSL